MKILVTGAAGFLGRGLIIPFEEHGHTLRLMDVAEFSSPRHEVVVGDVSNYDQVERAVQGMEGIVIAHMASRGPDDINYKTPQMAFDINVKGTAFLFHAAVKCGVRRVVVISSGPTVWGQTEVGPNWDRKQPFRTWGGYYILSKSIQEVIAEHFARTEKLAVACLRPAYIADGEANVDKYGRQIGERNFQDTDRRDIGEVARLCLERTDSTYECFTVMSTPESLEKADVRYTCERLGWKPRYDFSWLPKADGESKK